MMIYRFSAVWVSRFFRILAFCVVYISPFAQAAAQPPALGLSQALQQADSLLQQSPEDALALLRDWEDTALRSIESDEKSTFFFTKGKAEYAVKEIDSCQISMQRVIILLTDAEEDAQLLQLVDAYIYLGLTYKAQGKPELNLKSLIKALEILSDFPDKEKDLSNLYTNIGVAYRRMDQAEKAIENYLKALELAEKVGYKLGVARLNGNLGNLHKEQQEFDKALNYFSKSAQTFQELNQEVYQAVSLNNIGIIYDLKQQRELALSFYNKAYLLFEKNQVLGYAATCLNNIGVISFAQGNYGKAVDSYKQALKYFLEDGDPENVAKVKCNIGASYIQLKELEKGFDYLTDALADAKELNSMEVEIDCYENFCRYYELRGDYKQALVYNKKYADLRDTIFRMEKQQQIAEIESKYQLNKKEEENQQLRRNESIQNYIIEKKTFENQLLLAFAILLFIFAIAIFRLYFLNRKSKEMLQSQNQEIIRKQQEIISINVDLQQSKEQLHKANGQLQKMNANLEAEVSLRTLELQKTNEELDTFLYQSSHALRRPLVQILGLINLATIEDNHQEVEHIYKKLSQTTHDMDSMLRKLVMVSEISFTDKLKDRINLKELIDHVWEDLGRRQPTDKVDFRAELGPIPIENTGYSILVFVCFNLLENALIHNIPFTDKQLCVTVSAESEEDHIQIRFEDNGTGIPKEAFDRIFEMFTTASPNSGGHGLGLYIVQKGIKKLRGDIFLEKSSKEGTSFVMILPKDRTAVETTQGYTQKVLF